MPTYEYKCEDCGHTLEKFQSIKARPLRKCPACGLNKLKRLIGTGGGIIFKGSGFYHTDYKKKSGSSNQETKKTEKAEKTESKPAEKKTSEPKK